MGLLARLRRLDDSVLGPPRVSPWWSRAFGLALIPAGLALRSFGDALDEPHVAGAVVSAVVALAGLAVLALATRAAFAAGDAEALYGGAACWVVLGVAGPLFGVRQPVALGVHGLVLAIGVAVLLAARRLPSLVGPGDGLVPPT